MYAEINATIVFPEPTSPCNKRFIGFELSISSSISCKTLNCAFVNLKGKLFIISDIFAFLSKAIPSFSSSYLLFKLSNASCIDSNSSKTNLFLANLKFSKLSGKCICFIAVFMS